MTQAEKIRCPWCLGFEAYIRYHDEEWGVPVHEDRKHFEFLILEGAQAGLSWATILKKRAAYRQAFAAFDPEQVARFSEARLEQLLEDPGIVRNRLKIKAAVNNAQRFLEIQDEFGSFDRYIWRFVNGKPIVNSWKTLEEVPATSHEQRSGNPNRPVPLRVLAVNPTLGSAGDGGHLWATTTQADGGEANQALLIPKSWGGYFHFPLAQDVDPYPADGLAIDRATNRVYIASGFAPGRVTVIGDHADLCPDAFAKIASLESDLNRC